MSDSGPSEAGPRRRTDALLGAYAAGTLSEPFAVLVAAHLQMRAESGAQAASISDRGHWPHQPMAGLEQMNVFLPLALRSYVGRHLGALEWSTLLPGLERCRIARHARVEASLLRCRPGKAIPAHTHEGLEAALVLQGGFRDQNGHYIRGDIEVADATINHRPVADRPLGCIIFVALEAPVRLTGPIGRLLQHIFGT